MAGNEKDFEAGIIKKIEHIYNAGEVFDSLYRQALKQTKDEARAEMAAAFSVQAEKESRFRSFSDFILHLPDPAAGLLIASGHEKFGKEPQCWPKLAYAAITHMLEKQTAPSETAMLSLIGKIPKGYAFSDEDSKIGCSWSSLERDFFRLLSESGSLAAKKRLFDIAKSETDAERFMVAVEALFSENMRKLAGTPEACAYFLDLLCSPALFTRNFTSRAFAEEERLSPGANIPEGHNLRHTVIAQGIIRGLACVGGMEFNGQFEEAIIREAEYMPTSNATLWHRYIEILGKVGGELSVGKMKDYLESGKGDVFYSYNCSQIPAAISCIEKRIAARKLRASEVGKSISRLIMALAANAAKREVRLH